jgi:prephenate dehydrogenase
VGGHPLRGSEERGPTHARGALFDGATWYLCRLPATDQERLAAIERFVTSLGASPVTIDPDVHDRLVALVSHLPHALANTLLNQAATARIDGHDPLTAAGASFRDLTRIAGANADTWVDTFLSNAEELAAALGEHRRRLEELEAALRSRDDDTVRRTIEEAARNRARLARPA